MPWVLTERLANSTFICRIETHRKTRRPGKKQITQPHVNLRIPTFKYNLLRSRCIGMYSDLYWDYFHNQQP